MDREYLEGVALVKKSGGKMHIVHGPRGVADKTPVTASGTTVPRMLKDRFADVVNVKDFGAKGDGATDDTEAFKAAAEVGTVFVPRGRYVVHEFVKGDFRALPGTVVIYGSTTFAGAKQKISFKKDVLFVGTSDLPFYSFAKNRWGENLKMSLQGITTDDAFNFYITFSIDTKINNASDKMFLVSKFSNGFDYLGCAAFESSKFVEQVQIVNGCLEFAGTSTSIYSYSIDESTWNESVNSATGAEKKEVGNEYFDNDFQLYVYNETYFNSCRSAFAGSQGGDVSRDYIFSFDKETLKPTGVTKFEYQDVGWNGDASNATTPVRTAFPKRQSFCVTNNNFIFAVGAYWSDSFSDKEGYRLQGVKFFDRNGGFQGSLLMDPKKLRNKLQELGIGAQYVEQEGVTERYGQLFSVMAVGSEDTFVIFRECSDSLTAIDFSDCEAEESAYAAGGLFYNLPLFNLLPQNPYTGELFSSLSDVLVFMRDTKACTAAFTIYKGSAFDISGLGFTDTTVSINIFNRYGNAYLIHYITSDFRGCGTAYAVLNENKATITPVSNRTSNIVLTKDKDFSGTNGRIYFDDDGEKLLVKMVIHDDSQDVIEYGGNSSVMNAATSHGFFVTSTGEPKEKTGIGVLKIDYRGLWPYNTSAFSNGIPSRLWSQVYAASGAINTSDERYKQDVATPSDALLKALQNVDFHVFRFK